MKKLSLAVIALFINLFGAFAQSEPEYEKRQLSIEEVNFVSSYYTQDGNNSAVTGGVGTEQLTDFANQLDVRIITKDKKDRTHTITAAIGIDNYSSASSDKINPATISSASSADTRIYPKLGWSIHNPNTNTRMGVVGSFSSEFDYTSTGLGLNIVKASADNNREIGLNVQAYFDMWKAILPIELRPNNGEDEDDQYTLEPRNSFSASLVYSQLVNRRLQLALMVDGIYQQGLLATRFHRVYFNDGTLQAENLPDTRFKIPLGIRANYFIGNNIVIRSFYRYYMDNWGLNGHTFNIEMPVKLNPYLSLSPFYRYYNQSAVQYFKPYGQHAATDQFFTSDYDLSDFKSHFMGAGVRWAPENGVFGIKHLAVIELRYGHYMRSTGLTSDIVTLGFKLK